MGCPDITKIITLASPTTVYLNAVTNVAGVVVKHYSLISLIANVTGITAVKIG
jgi:L-aminopeptidase/D-esterase-like protein